MAQCFVMKILYNLGLGLDMCWLVFQKNRISKSKMAAVLNFYLKTWYRSNHLMKFHEIFIQHRSRCQHVLINFSEKLDFKIQDGSHLKVSSWSYCVHSTGQTAQYIVMKRLYNLGLGLDMCWLVFQKNQISKFKMATILNFYLKTHTQVKPLDELSWNL